MYEDHRQNKKRGVMEKREGRLEREEGNKTEERKAGCDPAFELLGSQSLWKLEQQV